MRLQLFHPATANGQIDTIKFARAPSNVINEMQKLSMMFYSTVADNGCLMLFGKPASLLLHH